MLGWPIADTEIIIVISHRMIVTLIQIIIPRRRRQKKPVLNVPGKVHVHSGSRVMSSFIMNKIYNVIHPRYGLQMYMYYIQKCRTYFLRNLKLAKN